LALLAEIKSYSANKDVAGYNRLKAMLDDPSIAIQQQNAAMVPPHTPVITPQAYGNGYQNGAGYRAPGYNSGYLKQVGRARC
jgi:hypothetical protein